MALNNFGRGRRPPPQQRQQQLNNNNNNNNYLDDPSSSTQGRPRGGQMQMMPNRLVPLKPENLFYKIQVYNSAHTNRQEILTRIQQTLGASIKFFSWITLPKKQPAILHDFYVKGRSLAESIGQLTCFGQGVTFRFNPNPQNPPTAKITPEFLKRLRVELFTRLDSRSGLLDLSNFSESNSLITDYFIPLNKQEIRGAVNDIILQDLIKDDASIIKSVDLSYNRLMNFQGLEFLESVKNMTALHVNDNDLQYATSLEHLSSTTMTNLTIRNNPFVLDPHGGPSQPLNYLPEIRKIFPNLVTLDSRPLSPLQPPTDSQQSPSSSTNDKDLHPPPSKISKLDSSDVNESNLNKDKEILNQKNETGNGPCDNTVILDKNKSTAAASAASSSSLVPSHPHHRQQNSHQSKANYDNIVHLTARDNRLKITSLENQLAKAFVEIGRLSKSVQNLTAFKQTVMSDFKQVQQDNLWLRSEIDRMKAQQQQQQLQQQQPRNYPTNFQMSMPSGASCVPNRPLSVPGHHPSSQYDYHHQPPLPPQPMVKPPEPVPPPPPIPSLLDDMTHLFDRPRRTQ